MLRLLLFSFIVTSAGAAGPGSTSVPLFFVSNHGQAPPPVRYIAQGPNLTAYFSPGEILFRLGDNAIRMQFPGSNRNALVEGLHPLPGQVNFLTGPKENWRTGETIYSAVAYRQLYPGIDMIYTGSTRNLKSEFIVAPGADPARIRIRYSGAGNLRIDPAGDLVISIDGREFREQFPYIYQVKNHNRQTVDGRFHLAADGTVSFIVKHYDPSLPLFIDPVVYSTLLGGASSDSAMALAVDSAGAAYVAGFTASLNFPAINPAQSFNSGSNDVFIAKLNPSGNGLVYCTYLGGKGDDRAFGIAVDATGAAYITGSTTSTGFPTRDPLQASMLGTRDAFIAKLNPDGNMLVFSTYLGGSGSDIGNGIALDGAGNVYITGDTTSTNFPTTALQQTNGGGMDVFVAKLNATGDTLLFSTYLGGSYDDHSSAVAVDAGGAAYVTGSTYSSDFPLSNPIQSQLGGAQDAFIARLAAAGDMLIFSTFLGGAGGALGLPESGQAIALDSQGNAYVTGSTSSTNFPLLHAVQSVKRGATDAFVAKVTSAGALVNSTYLGGAGVDAGNAIAVDSNGIAYIAGQTLSTDLAVANAVQSVSGGGYDGFLAKLAATGDSLLFLTYLGGNGSDTATAVALDASGSIYLAGWTLSTNFPVLGPYQAINAGTYGAFATMISMGEPPTADSVTPNSGTGAAQTFSFQFTNSAAATGLTSVSVLFQTSANTAGACSVTYNPTANTLALLTDTGAIPAGTIAPGGGTLQNSQCVLNGASSSVSLSGNILTLNLALSFKVALDGARNIYMQAINAFGGTGWQSRGAWTVTAGPPVPVSVSPSSGAGSSQTFAFAFTDPRGYAAISTTSMIIGSSLSGAGSCYLYYSRSANALYLANDAGTAWLAPVVPGSTGTVQNSQCSASAAGSSAIGSGNNLTLNVALTLKAAYAGGKNVYMEVYDGQDSGWLLKGAWTVPSTGPPSAVSVTPASGSGSSQTFAFVFSSPRGYTTITTTSMIVGTSLAGSNSCYLYYARAANAIYLANDAGSAWLAPAALGAAATVQNSQCSVSAAGSSASGSGNNLTLNLALTFKIAYAGAKNVQMQVTDAQNSGWQLKGSWTATLPAVLTAVSVTPNSGSGSTRSFGFLFYDPAGAANISSASMIVGTSLSGVGSCYLFYARATNLIYLANDAGSAWLAPAALGSAATVQNSQCSVNVTASSIVIGGAYLTVNLDLTFKPGYTGGKSIYMEVYNGTDTGWNQRGAWTIP